MIIIIFGLAASGKTYIGKILNKNFGIHHEDADRWLNQEMKEYIVEKKLFTLEMLEDFTLNIIANIEILREKYKNIVISQALYRQRNRETIKEYFSLKAPEEKLLFLQIDANDDIIYKRLLSRGDWVFPEYARSMKQFFEPMEGATIIQNNREGEDEITKQLQRLEVLSSFIKSK